MEAKELRIGNYIDLNGTIVKVAGVDAKKMVKHYLPETKQVVSKMENRVSNFKPVPITEEWLFKLGFEVKTQVATRCPFECLVKSGVSLITNSKKLIRFGYSGYCGSGEKEIKHVHQLQNLYFALTGKELEINQ